MASTLDESPEMMTPDFTTSARDAIFDLHVVLQAWFNAEGEDDPSAVAAHFDPEFRIISPAGKVMDFATFAAALPRLRGTRPGLLMEIFNVDVSLLADGVALVTYVERQTQGESSTTRISTALLRESSGSPRARWRHLQETFIA